jgi:hypothetical protein
MGKRRGSWVCFLQVVVLERNVKPLTLARPFAAGRMPKVGAKNVSIEANRAPLLCLPMT